MKPKIIHGASMYIYMCSHVHLCRFFLDGIFYIIKYYIIVSLHEKEKKKTFTEATIPQEILSACEYYEYTEYCNKITS